MAATPAKPRRTRSNGDESRARILAAATQVAAERGYEGTSIALVSERSGQPASSIYWHYASKDGLIAAVIEHSFGEWLTTMSSWSPLLDGLPLRERITASLQRTAKALVDSGDFLRLGLMLALERRPEEPSARKMFIRVRSESLRRTIDAYADLFPELDTAAVGQLATFTMALADGLFIAREIDGDAIDLATQFDTLAAAVLAAASHLASPSDPRSVVTDQRDLGRRAE